MRALFRINFFFLITILQISRLHGQSTTGNPITSTGSNPYTSTLVNQTNGSSTTNTYESHYNATSHNGTATAATQTTIAYISTKNTSATDSLGTSVASNWNSTENHTALATDTPISHFSSSPTAVPTLISTNATTTNLTNNGSYVSTMFTTDVSLTTDNANNSATTTQFNVTTHRSNDNVTTPSVLNTTFSASTQFNISENSTLSTTMKKENITTVQTTDGSLTTENVTLIVIPKTSPKPTVPPTTNSSFTRYTDGTPKEAQTNGGVVFGAIIGSILGIILVLLVGYFICGVRKPDAFTHRRLYEDIKNEPVLRLDDSVEPYDLRYGESSYHNPTVVDETEYRHAGNKLDFIPMDNISSNHPSA